MHNLDRSTREDRADTGTILAAQRTLLEKKFDGKSRTWFWRLRRDRSLDFPEPVIIGGQPFWDVADVDQWIARQRKGGV